MKTIPQWLSDRLRNTGCEEGRRISIGTPAINFVYEFPEKKGRKHSIICNESEITVQKPKLIFEFEREAGLLSLLRIPETPFYVSRFSVADDVLWTIDFFDLNAEPQFYRVFLSSGSRLFTISVIGKEKWKKSGQNCSANGWELSSEKITCRENRLSLDSSAHELVIRFGLKSSELKKIDWQWKLKSLINECRQNHPLNSFLSNDIRLNQQADRLFAEQKTFLPSDGTHPVESRESIKTASFLKNQLLFVFGLNAGKAVPSEKQLHQFCDELQNNEDIKDSVHKLTLEVLVGGIACYFSNREPDADYLSDLQHWWNLISTPLFRYRLRALMQNYTEEMIVLALMALRWKIPMGSVLYDRIAEWVENHENLSGDTAFLKLVMLIFKHIQVLPRSENEIDIFPLTPVNGNKLQISAVQTKDFIRFTSYSNSFYTSIGDRFKIDKRVILQVGRTAERTHITVSPVCAPGLILNRNLHIRAADVDLTVPVIWKNCSIVLKRFKIKWIIKKHRLQVIVTSRNGDGVVEINGE